MRRGKNKVESSTQESSRIDASYLISNIAQSGIRSTVPVQAGTVVGRKACPEFTEIKTSIPEISTDKSYEVAASS